MKIELKKLKTNESFSEETICFTSDLYINGKKRGYCKNDGRGGCTYYSHYKQEDRKVIEECEKYCKTLPKVKYGNHEWEQSLEGVINDIVDKHHNEKEKQKFQKKMERDMLTKLVLSKGNPNQYETVSWKKITIQQLINHPQGKENLKNTIKKMKEKGYTILNTNIPKEYL